MRANITKYFKYLFYLFHIPKLYYESKREYIIKSLKIIINAGYTTYMGCIG